MQTKSTLISMGIWDVDFMGNLLVSHHQVDNQ